MKEAVIFMGIQASGKSTFFQKRFTSSHVHINLDTLRTRGRERALLADCLGQGKSFVVDNTNPTRRDRKRYIEAAWMEGYRVTGYFFRSVVQDCIARNAGRERAVPAHVIAHTSNILELPSLAEGFDELYFVAQDGKGDFSVSEWREES